MDVEDVLNFFCTVIRPVLEYCAQAFHHSLPKYLAGKLDVVHKRVLKIISPEMPYREALEYFKLPTLFQRKEDMCNKLFTKTSEEPTHKLQSSVVPEE